jgi:hypothetical protein
MVKYVEDIMKKLQDEIDLSKSDLKLAVSIAKSDLKATQEKTAN